MDNPMSVDLRKLKKSAEVRNFEPVHLAPPPAPPVPQPPRAVVTPPPPPQPVMQARPAAAAASAPPRIPAKPSLGRKLPVKMLVIWGIGAILVIGAGYYIYSNFWTRSPFGPTPGASAETDTSSAAAAATAAQAAEPTEAEIVAKVGTLMLLPDNETPALAKVSDLSALSSQAFFARAKVGDIVLMYPRAARAILYDPVANKVIEVGPIQNATTTPPTSS